MELLFSADAKNELETMDVGMKTLFILHLEKIHTRPPRKHLQYGIPCHGENVTKQARIIYDIRGDRTYILHCFATHKDYEHWYKSYK